VRASGRPSRPELALGDRIILQLVMTTALDAGLPDDLLGCLSGVAIKHP
jgi:hypothetical protein